jgi:cytochrome b
MACVLLNQFGLEGGETPHRWTGYTATALVLALGATGWLQGSDAWFGDEGLQDLHALLADGLLWAAGLHAAAAIMMGRLERVHLVRAMVTGVKQRYWAHRAPASGGRPEMAG